MFKGQNTFDLNNKRETSKESAPTGTPYTTLYDTRSENLGSSNRIPTGTHYTAFNEHSNDTASFSSSVPNQTSYSSLSKRLRSHSLPDLTILGENNSPVDRSLKKSRSADEQPKQTFLDNFKNNPPVDKSLQESRSVNGLARTYDVKEKIHIPIAPEDTDLVCPISVCKPLPQYHDKEHFRDIVRQYINGDGADGKSRPKRSVTFVITDTLQYESYLYDLIREEKLEESIMSSGKIPYDLKVKALKRAIEAGQKWLEKMQEVFQEIKIPWTVVYWDEVEATKEFEEKQNTLDELLTQKMEASRKIPFADTINQSVEPILTNRYHFPKESAAGAQQNKSKDFARKVLKGYTTNETVGEASWGKENNPLLAWTQGENKIKPFPTTVKKRDPLTGKMEVLPLPPEADQRQRFRVPKMGCNPKAQKILVYPTKLHQAMYRFHQLDPDAKEDGKTKFLPHQYFEFDKPKVKNTQHSSPVKQKNYSVQPSLDSSSKVSKQALPKELGEEFGPKLKPAWNLSTATLASLEDKRAIKIFVAQFEKFNDANVNDKSKFDELSAEVVETFAAQCERQKINPETKESLIILLKTIGKAIKKIFEEVADFTIKQIGKFFEGIKKVANDILLNTVRKNIPPQKLFHSQDPKSDLELKNLKPGSSSDDETNEVLKSVQELKEAFVKQHVETEGLKQTNQELKNEIQNMSLLVRQLLMVHLGQNANLPPELPSHINDALALPKAPSKQNFPLVWNNSPINAGSNTNSASNNSASSNSPQYQQSQQVQSEQQKTGSKSTSPTNVKT